MNLKTFQCFLCAAEEMNFSRAAERLFMSQQSLSNHIKRLEDNYGVTLFERSPHLRLTLAGERMLFHAKKILSAQQQLEVDFADISSSRRQKISVGLSRTRAAAFVPAIMERFHARYPNISVSLYEDISKKMAPLLLDGVLDLYIGVNTTQNSLFEIHPLAREKQYCLVSKALLMQYFPTNWEAVLTACRNGISLPDLLLFTKMPFMMLSPENRMRISLDYLLRSNGILPNCIFETLDQGVILKLSLAGYGVGFVSQAFFYSEHSRILGSSNLFAFPVEIDSMDISVHLVTLPNPRRPRYVQTFIDTTKDFFAQYVDEVKRLSNHRPLV